VKKTAARFLLVLLLAISVVAPAFASHKQAVPTSVKQQEKLQKKQMKKQQKLVKKQQKQQMKAQKKANKQLKKRREQGYAF